MWKIFTVIVGMILIYWVVLLKIHGNEKGAVNADFMNKIVFDFPFGNEACCSWWPISHFILFTFIGFLFPECDIMALSAGIGWELIEVGVYYYMGADRQGVRRSGSNKVEYSESWWSGSFKDIFMNTSGFYTGKLLQTLYGKKLCIEKLGNCTDQRSDADRCECDHIKNKMIDDEIKKKMKVMNK